MNLVSAHEQSTDLTDLVEAAFLLAERDGWEYFRLVEICRFTDISPSRLKELCPNKTRLIEIFDELADAQAQIELAEDSNGSARERLFSYFMTRLDFYQENRNGVLDMLKRVPCDPSALKASLKSALRFSKNLEHELFATSWRTPLRVQAIMSLWAWTLRQWRRDETRDMAQTMHALDRMLAKIENNGFLK